MIAVVIGAFLLGWLIHSRIVMSPRVIHGADQYVIKFALPILVFSKISRMSIDGTLLVPAAIAWIVMLSAMVLLMLLSRQQGWDEKTTGALLMVGVLGNTSFLGLGMVEGLLGTNHLSSAVAYDQLGTFLGLSVYGSLVVSRYGAANFSMKVIGNRLIRFVPFLALLAAFPARSLNLPNGMYDIFDVIGKTAEALTDLIDAERSVRLEWTIIILIVVEILLSLFQIFYGRH